MKITAQVLIIVLFCWSSGGFAEGLSERYLTNHAALYGIQAESNEILTTSARVMTITKQFENDPELLKLVEAFVLNPDSTELQTWIDKQAPPATQVITTPIDWIYQQVAGGSSVQKYLSKDIHEFETCISPFVSMRKLNVPFPDLFDYTYAHYVRAGLLRKLTPEQLQEMKTILVDNMKNSDPESLGTNSLLLEVYIHQSSDAEFLNQVWSDYPAYRPVVLFICIYSNADPAIVNYGYRLVESLYQDCEKPTSGEEMGFEFLAVTFLQFHMDKHPLVNQLAAQIAEKPLQFQSERPRLLYFLKQTKAQYPWVKETIESINKENRSLENTLSE